MWPLENLSVHIDETLTHRTLPVCRTENLWNILHCFVSFSDFSSHWRPGLLHLGLLLAFLRLAVKQKISSTDCHSLVQDNRCQSAQFPQELNQPQVIYLKLWLPTRRTYNYKPTYVVQNDSACAPNQNHHRPVTFMSAYIFYVHVYIFLGYFIVREPWG